MTPAVRSIAVLLLIHTLAVGAWGQGQLSRHPYLQLATQDSVAILWRTVGRTIPIVRYGPAPDVLVNEILPVQVVVRLGPDLQGPVGLPRLHSAPPATYQYEASIFGLQPGTTYYYGVYDGDRLLAGGSVEHRFTTLPQSGTENALRLWVVGGHRRRQPGSDRWVRGDAGLCHRRWEGD